MRAALTCYWAQFWEVTQCQWQKRFDPGFTTYVDGPNNVEGSGGYDYVLRVTSDPSIAERVATVATTGKIMRPLITVAGTMDALLPITRGARAYEAAVNGHHRGDNYRLYEVQNGNHIETFKNTFPGAGIHPATRAAGLRSARGSRRESCAPAAQPVTFRAAA
jgi:hypothetical protein